MGFFDAIKRWRLAQQGLSSGKKRRVHAEHPIVQVLEESLWLKFSLFVLFALSTAVMVLKSADNSSFALDPVRGAIYGIIIATTAVVMFHVGLPKSCHRNSRVFLVLGGLVGHLIMVRLVMGLTDHGQIPEVYRFFFVPFSLAPMLHGVLLGRAVGAFSTVYVTLIGGLLAPRGETLGYMILSLVAGITSVLVTHRVRKRQQLLQAGIYAGLVTLLVGILLGRLDLASCFGSNAIDHLAVFGKGSLAILGSAVAVSLLINGLLPIFEGMFHLTTDISWLELGDLNHRLLRRMQLEAPGTFHHSMVIAALAEAAAEKIGANSLMCRVCSYFHDVGKLNKPSYFIENQQEGIENPHDALTPTMSALIIISHVKDGVDLAVKHKLNPRIIDVIEEHHGDSIVRIFYRKAQEQKKLELEKAGRGLENPEDVPDVEEKNFRYPGPKPTSRESGIISLADCVESASRNLSKPTPARIRALVDDMVRSRIEDGQLDDCLLTLRELTLVKESFANTLRSMLHSRIEYPKDESRPSDGSRWEDADSDLPTLPLRTENQSPRPPNPTSPIRP